MHRPGRYGTGLITTMRKELEVRSSLIVVTAWAALTSGAFGQPLSADKVPAKIRRAFQTKFPGVDKVEWKLKSDKNYEAEFTQKDVEVTAKFDDKGKWLETETAIEQSELPKEVLAAIAREYKGHKIIETQKVERADDKPMLFEVHVENAKETLKVQFEGNGTIASKETKKLRKSVQRPKQEAYQR